MARAVQLRVRGAIIVLEAYKWIISSARGGCTSTELGIQQTGFIAAGGSTHSSKGGTRGCRSRRRLHHLSTMPTAPGQAPGSEGAAEMPSGVNTGKGRGALRQGARRCVPDKRAPKKHTRFGEGAGDAAQEAAHGVKMPPPRWRS